MPAAGVLWPCDIWHEATSDAALPAGPASCSTVIGPSASRSGIRSAASTWMTWVTDPHPHDISEACRRMPCHQPSAVMCRERSGAIEVPMQLCTGDHLRARESR